MTWKLTLEFYGWIERFANEMKDAFEAHAEDKGSDLPAKGQEDYYIEQWEIHHDKYIMAKAQRDNVSAKRHLVAVANYALLLFREACWWMPKISMKSGRADT